MIKKSILKYRMLTIGYRVIFFSSYCKKEREIQS